MDALTQRRVEVTKTRLSAVREVVMECAAAVAVVEESKMCGTVAVPHFVVCGKAESVLY